MEGMPAEGTGLPIVGAEIAGKYRIESILGQGGMGAVYAARNVMTGKRVAIKWLLPEHAASNTRERLLREAQCAASIDHPNVVDIYDVGEHQGGLFLVMEYLRGKPLSDVLAERGRLDPDELVAMLVPAMRGVHAAHQAGVIHRDLKPENILLSESDGQIVPKVVDFGVSKNVGASAMPNSSLTRTGALVGTPHYMALEQVDGSNAIDSRTDVYAFGVLLYRALTGHFPFDGTSLGEVILKIGTKEAPAMRTLRPELPLALDTLVLRALSRDRTKRFSDLEELARGLSQFSNWRTGSASLDPSMTPGAMAFRPFGAASAESVGGGQTPSSARATPPIGPGSQKRRRTLLIAGVAALSLLVTGAYLTYRNGADAPLATPLRNTSQPADKAVGAVRSAKLPPTARAVPALGALAQQPGVAAAGVLPTSILDGKDGPEQLEATTPAEPVAVQPVAPEPVRTREAAPSQRVEKSRNNADRNNADRNNGKRNDARTPSAGRKNPSHGSGVVAGERTNGFSVDEF